jgi:hypothetical protein
MMWAGRLAPACGVGAEGEEMKVDGLRELDEMAAKLEATIHKLPQVKRDELLRDIKGIRAQLTGLLSEFRADARPDRLNTKPAATGR